MNTLHKTNRQKGFSLIELMIVVAILGILAAIAIPAYNDYTVRARVSDMITMSNSAKVAVSEYYSSEGSLPASNSAAGLPDSTDIKSDIVTAVAVGTNGVITVSSTNANLGIDATTTAVSILLTPTSGTGSLSWSCSTPATGGLDSRYLPASCR